MTRLPEQFVDVMRQDRFCTGCGTNLCGEAIVREPHYDMLILTCPNCRAIAQVQEQRWLTRTGQRWAGVALALWVIVLATLWLGGGALLSGLGVGVLQESHYALRRAIVAQFEKVNPEDEGGVFETSVQIVRTPQAALKAGQTTVSMPGVIPVPGQPTVVTPANSPIQVIVTKQDDGLRNRFGRWWDRQDPKAVLAMAGGWREAVPWRDLGPWAMLGLIPFLLGCLWSLYMINMSRHRMLMMWPLVCSLYLGALIVCAMFVLQNPVSSPSDAAMLLLMPSMFTIFAVFNVSLILAGMMLGRPLARGIVRLALSPRACSALAQLWLSDGKQAPRVRVT